MALVVGQSSRLFPESITKQNLTLRAGVRQILSNPNPFGEFKMVRVLDLNTETVYQRAISSERVLEMVRNFDPALFQPLTVAERRSTLYVVDGQHRLATAEELGIELVPCMIYQTKDAATEARRFVELQEKRRTLMSVHKFQAQLVYRDTAAIEVDKLFRKYKFTLADPNKFNTRRTDNVVRCVGKFLQIHRMGGIERCDFILYIMRYAWDGQSEAQRREIVSGLGRVHQKGVQSGRLAARALSQIEPFTLLQRSKRLAHNNEMPEIEAFAQIVLDMIDKEQ